MTSGRRRIAGRLAWLILSTFAAAPVSAQTPTERAVRFLSKEVPSWAQENHCHSCHNNGDAARALYTAAQLGYPRLGPALVDTTAWLAAPQRWAKNRGDPQVSDQRLATVQFAHTLLTALEAGQGGSSGALRQAAELVVEHQTAAGSWPIDAPGSLGSPATYGETLATLTARRVLVAAGRERFAAAIGLADTWLGQQRPPERVRCRGVVAGAARLGATS